MLDSKDSGVMMTSSHRISFSIIDILDPKKFNSKRINEHSIAKFPASGVEGESLDASTNRVDRTKTGRKVQMGYTGSI